MHNRSSLFMTFRVLQPVSAEHLFHRCTPCSARRLLLENAARSEDKLARATERWPVLGVAQWFVWAENGSKQGDRYGRTGPLRLGRRGVVIVIGCMHKIVTSHEVGYTGRKNVGGSQRQDMSRQKTVSAKEIDQDLHPCCS